MTIMVIAKTEGPVFFVNGSIALVIIATGVVAANIRLYCHRFVLNLYLLITFKPKINFYFMWFYIIIIKSQFLINRLFCLNLLIIEHPYRKDFLKTRYVLQLITHWIGVASSTLHRENNWCLKNIHLAIYSY